MKLNQFLTLGFVILLVGIYSDAAADEYLFVTFEYPPLEFEGDQGLAQGIAVEIVRDVMHNLSYGVQIQVFPWTRALDMVRFGRADAIFTAYKNPAREQFLNYTKEVLFQQEIYFYRKKGSLVDFNGNLASVQDKIVGVVSTISYGRMFDSTKPDLDLDKANRLEHSFQKLVMGRIDLVPSDIYVAEHTIQTMGLAGKIERLPRMIESVPSYIAFSKQRNLTHLRDQFNRQLSKMKANGAYAGILKRHGIRFDE